MGKSRSDRPPLADRTGASWQLGGLRSARQEKDADREQSVSVSKVAYTQLVNLCPVATSTGNTSKCEWQWSWNCAPSPRAHRAERSLRWVAGRTTWRPTPRRRRRARRGGSSGRCRRQCREAPLQAAPADENLSGLLLLDRFQSITLSAPWSQLPDVINPYSARGLEERPVSHAPVQIPHYSAQMGFQRLDIR